MKKTTRIIAILVALLVFGSILPYQTFATTTDKSVMQRDIGDHSVTEVEPNYNASLADRIYNDYTVSGNITSQDLDCFEFVLPSRSYVQIVMVADYSTTYLGLLDASEEVIAADTTGSYTNGGYYGYNLSLYLDAGTYYICILDSVNYHSHNYYTFYFEYARTACSHSSYSTVVTPPTCEEDGYTTYYCNNCTHQWTGSPVSATGHLYENHVCTECDAVESGYTLADVSYIQVTKLPNKTVYILDLERLDVTGGVVTVYFNNGDSMDFPMESSMISSYDDSSAGRKTVLVSFAGKTCTYEVRFVEETTINPNGPIITVGNGTVAAGQDVTVSIDISNNPGIQYLNLSLDYPQDVFEIVSVRNGGIISNFINSGDNYVWQSTNPSFENGNLLTITLRALAGQAEGDYDIGVILHDAYNGNADIDFQIAEGAIEYINRYYTVTFKNWNGSIIKSKAYHYGDQVEIPANPTRANDSAYTYTFSGWQPQVATTCTGNATYTAQYTAQRYYPGFPDVRPNAWYYDAVKFAVEKGYFTGHGNGTFGPSQGITRQDFVVVLARISGADLSKYSGVTNFKDVSSKAYYAKAIHWAVSNSVLSGYNATTFGVGDTITREQLVIILYRYALSKGYDTSVSSNATARLDAFADVKRIASYARPACAWALEKGVLSGKNATTFDPKGEATRAQVAQILMNISLKGIMPI